MPNLFKLTKASVLTFLIALFSYSSQADTAIFAGGCFWCMEADFQEVHGVKTVISGYTGGHTKNPTYKLVTKGHTGHYEAVKVTFDPGIISYQQLLDIFWVNIDPFDKQGQFCDKGSSYLSAIFTQNAQQKSLAGQSIIKQQKRFKTLPIVTPILDAASFYPAEGYHQDYYQKNSVRYKYYRWNCGRDSRLKAIWGDRKGQ